MELQHHVNSLHSSSKRIHEFDDSTQQEQLDRGGTQLWNLAARLHRDHGNVQNQDLCLTRAFAFLLLDSAQTTEREHGDSNVVRLMKVALKAAKICLEDAQIELCQKVMERAAAYENRLPKSQSDKDDEEEMHLSGRLRTEYFTLRTALARKAR